MRTEREGFANSSHLLKENGVSGIKEMAEADCKPHKHQYELLDHPKIDPNRTGLIWPKESYTL